MCFVQYACLHSTGLIDVRFKFAFFPFISHTPATCILNGSSGVHDLDRFSW